MHHAATRRAVKQTIRSNLGFLINEMISILFASRVSLKFSKAPSQLCCRFNRCNLPKRHTEEPYVTLTLTRSTFTESQ